MSSDESSEIPKREEYMAAIAEELHRPVRRKYPRRSVRAPSKDAIWSMDLVDMIEWADQNDGEKYMLNVVDVFTRFAWSRPMKTKNATDTFAAFISIVDETKRKPKKIWVDRGSEFNNRIFKTWMRANDCLMYSTFGESKSVIVERFNKTLKTKMWKYFTEKNTRRWVDNLQDWLRWYNTRVHSTLGMSPWEASKKKNFEKVNERINPEPDDEGGDRKPKYELGDWVRISRIKGVFEKGYHANFSQETFQIDEIDVPFDSQEPIVYKLKDRKGEVLEGSFYEQELTKAKYPNVLLVENVLKEKKIKGVNHLLVKWLGYSDKWNSWVPETDILDFLNKKYSVKSASEEKIVIKKHK